MLNSNFLLQYVLTLALMLPWLNPFLAGPSPVVIPWLTSAVSAALYILIYSYLSFRDPNGVKQEGGASSHLSLTVTSAWLLAGLVSSALALIQYFGFADLFEPYISPSRLGEAFANLRQRNQFATLTNVALAALLWFASSEKLLHRTLGRGPWLLVLLGCVLAIGNAATQSRTGIAQLALVCILCAVWGHWRHALVRKILMATAISYAVAAFALPVLAGFDLSTFGIAARLREGDQPCASRITLWSNVIHLIAEKPWLGWGWGELDYAHFITLYNGPRFCDILDNAHNLPLHLAVELGVPIAVLICGGFSWWVVRQKPWVERDATRQMAWAVLAVILLHSLLEYPLWYGPFQMAFLICIRLLWRPKPLSDIKISSEKISKWSLAQLILVLLAIILIVCSGYAAWDYRRISQIYLPPDLRAAAYRVDTLNKIRNSWLFADQVQFAELMVTPLTLANAKWTFDTATRLLHYSPEPRVVEKLIESSVLLGKDDDALFYLVRFRAAFPAEHKRWAKAQQLAPSKQTLKR